MEFTNRVSEDDYLAAFRLNKRNELSKVGDLVVVLGLVYSLGILVVFIAGFFPNALDLGWIGDLFSIRNHRVNRLLNVAYILLIALSHKVYLPWRARRTYRRSEKLKRDTPVIANLDAITMEWPNGSTSARPWYTFTSWRESEKIFLLSPPSKSYYVFAKSCMTGPQQDEFRELLTQRLPKE